MFTSFSFRLRVRPILHDMENREFVFHVTLRAARFYRTYWNDCYNVTMLSNFCLLTGKVRLKKLVYYDFNFICAGITIYSYQHLQ